MKIRYASTNRPAVISEAKRLARAEFRRNYDKYALVVFTSTTSADVQFFSEKEAAHRARIAVQLHVTCVVVEMD